jgi:hypothetical protein
LNELSGMDRSPAMSETGIKLAVFDSPIRIDKTEGECMQILKIDHLGIAVNSIDDGKNFWSDVLGLAIRRG